MEKRDAIGSAHDLQDNSQGTCSCSKTTPSDHKSSSPVCKNSTAPQPRNTSLGAAPVIESASATTSSKNHTDSAPFVIFAISIVVLLFAYPTLTNFTRDSITRLQQWVESSRSAEQNHPRQRRPRSHQNGTTLPEEFFFAIPNPLEDDSYE